MRTTIASRLLLVAISVTLSHCTPSLGIAADAIGPAMLVPRLTQVDGIWTVEIVQGERVIGAIAPNVSAGLEVRLPGDKQFHAVAFHKKRDIGASSS